MMTRRHLFAAIAAAHASRALGGFAHPPTRVFRIGSLGAESATAAQPGPGVLVTLPHSLLLRADDVIR